MKQKMTKAELIEALDAAEARIANLEASPVASALRGSEERLRLSLAASKQGMYDVNLVTGETIVNREYAEMLGYDLESFDKSYQAWEQRLHPEDQAETRRALKDFLNGNSSQYLQEFRLRTKDGSWKWIQSYGRVVERDADGKALRQVGTHTDITKQKMAQIELQKRAAQLAIINDVGRQITGVLNLQGVFNSSARLIRESFGHHHVGLFMLNEAKGRLEMKANAGEYSALFPFDHHIRLGEGVVGSVGMSGQMVLANEVEQDARYKNFIPSILPTRSELALPIKVMGKLKGVLDVQSPQPDAFNEGDIKVLETLADQIAVAIENARLISELEERVQQRAAEAQSLYDNAPIGYHSLDQENRIVAINQTEMTWLGHTLEEMLGRSIMDFLTPESREAFERAFPVFKQQGQLNGLELEFLRKDGSSFPALVNAVAIMDESGNYLMRRSAVFDNTERKKAELALKQSEETYRALFNNANDAVFLFDVHGTVLQANPNCYNLLGVTSEKMIRRNMNEFIPPSELENNRAKKQKLLSGEHLRPYESRMLRFDGNMMEVEINLSLVRDEDGSPKFIQSAIRNISKRKEAENAQRESEEQNRLLFEEAPEALVLFDQSGRVIRINHAFETITGITAGQIIGNMIMQLGILPHDLMNALTASQIDPFEHRHNSASLEFKLNHTSGEERYISTRIFVLNLRGGLHYLASMYDITLRKKAEETLRFANAEMERALRLKDEFLANMSHELRTPLNAILGISESLLEQVPGTLNEKQSKYLQTVLESGRHLLELINDILDLAKINAGRIDLEVQKVFIEGAAQSSLRMIRQLAFKNEQQVLLEIDENCKTIVADERRLKQMLVNLLGNAVKFTPRGGQLGLQIRGDVENQIMQFTVWDTGIGIEKKDLPRLFQPFIQLDAGLARSSQGTGLGLTLVSQMARLHRGSVSVESKPGAGSRFTINLPWEQDQAPVLIDEPKAETSTSQQDNPSIVKRENQTILLVEDTEALSAMLQDYLKIHGYQVVIARDGLEGIEQARATPPDLILMDVMMPEMDGYESTRRIRADLKLTHVPIIALTALAMAGDRERCLAAGMNDYISKPIKLTDLLKIIEKHIESRKGEHNEK